MVLLGDGASMRTCLRGAQEIADGQDHDEDVEEPKPLRGHVFQGSAGMFTSPCFKKGPEAWH